MSFKKIAVASVLSASLLMAAEVSAQEGQASGTGTITGSVTVVSDYVFRGVTQTAEKPALQAGVNWEHASGFYAGAWGSSISWLSDADPAISSQVELDTYFGYAGQFGDSGVSYDVGANLYFYPGHYPSGFNKADTTELYFGLGWNVLSAKYSYAVTDLFGVDNSDGSSALDLGADWEFDGGWSLGVGWGRQWVSGQGGSADYDYYKLAAGKSFDNGFAVGLEWHDTDIGGAKDTFLVSLSKSF